LEKALTLSKNTKHEISSTAAAHVAILPNADCAAQASEPSAVQAPDRRGDQGLLVSV
jgi:hypothetical protein